MDDEEMTASADDGTVPGITHTLTVRVSLENKPGTFAAVASKIGEVGGNLGAVDIVRVTQKEKIRDVTFAVRDEEHGDEIVRVIDKIPGVSVINVSDPLFLMHLGGKIEVRSKMPIKTRAALSMAYTPGVARICKSIHEKPARAFRLTMKKNMVAIVTDGSAVLGLGNIGPEAAMPVMEGKAMLFKEFAGVNAFPICLATQDVEEIVSAVRWMAPGFGGINLEDISAPRCFEIEERLRQELDIPVFHDDQHGTAIVVLAGTINALKIVGKRIEDIRIVVNGIGAGGAACIRFLLNNGAGDVIACDRAGALYRGRTERMNPTKEWIANHTNEKNFEGSLTEACKGADAFLGLSSPDVLSEDAVQSMAKDPIIFALANPVPEIPPEVAARHAAVVATGRSDYPNQVNNALCFPGMFKGTLMVRASCINEEMKTAAAHAIAGIIADEELANDYIIPSIFDERVVERVAHAVANAAHETGVARRKRKPA